MTISWNTPLFVETGSPDLMAGVVVMWDFAWSTEIPKKKRRNQRTFPRGKRLAELVASECHSVTNGTHKPALVLTVDPDVEEGPRQENGFYAVVVNIRAYLAFAGLRRASDPAATYFALRCKQPISRLSKLQELDLTPKALEALREVVTANPSRFSSLARVLLEAGAADLGIGVDGAQAALDHLASLSGSDLSAVASAKAELGTELLGRLLSWAASYRKVADTVDLIGPDGLTQLSALVGIASIRHAGTIWESYLGNPSDPTTKSEEHWQQTFVQYHFLIEHLFAYPVAIVASKAYVGGKNIHNKDGNVVDFLLKNDLTQSAIIIEIKTPGARLLRNGEYRQGLPNISEELSGSVLQALDYRASFTQNWAPLNTETAGGIPAAVEPPCIVIIGCSTELDTPPKKKSFELFRRQFTGVTVLTFDEVFGRAERLIKLLSGES